MDSLPPELQAQILLAASSSSLSALLSLSSVNKRFQDLYISRQRQLLALFVEAFIPPTCIEACQILRLMPVTRFLNYGSEEDCECCFPFNDHRTAVLQQTMRGLSGTTFELERLGEVELKAVITTHARVSYIVDACKAGKAHRHTPVTYEIDPRAFLDENSKELNDMYGTLIWMNFIFAYSNPRLVKTSLRSHLRRSWLDWDHLETQNKVAVLAKALSVMLDQVWYGNDPWPFTFLYNASVDEIWEVFRRESMARKLAIFSEVHNREHGAFAMSPLWELREARARQ